MLIHITRTVMRKLFLDILDYIQTGRRLPHCAVCDSRYNDAKPFIEGTAGVLVCAACIHGVDLDLYLATHRLVQHTDDGNPYRPPRVDSGAVPCLLCDQQTFSHVDLRAN